MQPFAVLFPKWNKTRCSSRREPQQTLPDKVGKSRQQATLCSIHAPAALAQPVLAELLLKQTLTKEEVITISPRLSISKITCTWHVLFVFTL